MTRVDFHTHVANRLEYACRFARKVYGAGQTLVVVGEPDMLRAFDQALWTFSPLEFVPHCFTRDPLAAQTPVVLAAPTRRPSIIRYCLIWRLGCPRTSHVSNAWSRSWATRRTNCPVPESATVSIGIAATR